MVLAYLPSRRHLARGEAPWSSTGGASNCRQNQQNWTVWFFLFQAEASGSYPICVATPSINKNLVIGSQLCRDGFKVVFESNKFVVSKCGQFIGKGYVCGGLFHVSVSDFCNKTMNNICDGINESDASIWHSCLCHLNFGSMSRLSSLNLIPNLSVSKGSKCQSCVQSEQPRKAHKEAKERHLAPLELIHSDICKMNGVLTEGGQRYFMT
jgi:hypothetical protein